jgi:MAP/microtubule affinity-regulating kinase
MNFYKYGRLLGKGAFGKVNLSLHVLTGRLVAIKSINKSKLMNEKQRRKIMLETSIMKTLSKSNNIVKIFETYETKKHYCIVMEYICAGDLLSYIKKRGKLTEQVAKFIFKQIVLSLQYIHSHNIVHRDIKLDNILIDLDNNIKICDFGVSKIVKKGEPMMEQCGTPAYIAPEILLNKGYEGFGVDIWSAGVVLYAMLGGTVPFKGNNIDELHDLIIKGEFKPLKDISPDATHLIRSILEVDPKKRIGTKDILVHPWLINVDLNFWKTQNLFTNAEYILLAKSNVDYRDISNKDDMIEIFDIKNLDTNDENRNKNVKTKSFILAPFNSSMEEDNDGVNANINESLDFYDSDLQIQNGLIKFNNKVKDLNRNYELNNNKEIDNGVVISPHNSDEKNKKENNDISPNNGSFNNNNSKGISKAFSPNPEPDENNLNINKNKYNNKENEINEKALEDLKALGYKKTFVKESLMRNNFNYATTSYGLIVKYCYS